MLNLLLVLAPLSADASDAFHSKSQNLEVRMGPATLSDSNITTVYGDSGNQFFFLQSGLQFYRSLEIDAGLGFLRESDPAIGADSGEESGYTTRLSLLPLSLSATARSEGPC